MCRSAELPPRVNIEDWVELKTHDLDAYRHAVAAGNFMAMRRAAYAPGRPADSAKLGRLVEIVEEAAANGRKVVVFDQAIARCHRMGQTRSIEVHRLLAEDTVDQRMLEILATKSVLFDEYVHRAPVYAAGLLPLALSAGACPLSVPALLGGARSLLEF